MLIRRKLKTTVARMLRSLLDDLLQQESRNIPRWPQEQAREQSGLFVEEHLPLVQSFDSRYALFEHLLTSERIAEQQGLICEFGVAAGKSINFLAERLKNKTLYGFDSFEGLPETWRSDVRRGAFAAATLPVVSPNVELVQGLFQNTLPQFLESHSGDALLLHIDCDLYTSTKTVFELMRPRIVPGTIIAFDEFFNYPGWREGEAKAFFEFIEISNHRFEYLAYNGLGTQLAVRITEN